MTTESDHDQPETSSGTLIAPLLGVAFDEIPDDVALATDIQVAPREALLGAIEPWEDVPTKDNQTLATATHVVVLPDVSFWVWPDHGTTPQPTDATSERLEDFAAILSLSARGFVGYAEVSVLLSASDHPAQQVSSFLLRDFARRLDAVSKFGPKLVEPPQLREAVERWRLLPRRHPSLRTAARRLVVAWLRDHDSHDSIVDYCIGIEALVGEGANELVNRISLRSAAMLASVGWKPSSETAKAIRDIYSYRSQVVHGVPGPYKREMITMGESPPIHAVRFALAALINLLEVYFANEELHPGNVDERFIFAAFDRPEQSRGQS